MVLPTLGEALLRSDPSSSQLPALMINSFMLDRGVTSQQLHLLRHAVYKVEGVLEGFSIECDTHSGVRGQADLVESSKILDNEWLLKWLTTGASFSRFRAQEELCPVSVVRPIARVKGKKADARARTPYTNHVVLLCAILRCCLNDLVQNGWV